jgi:hypothetical protein
MTGSQTLEIRRTKAPLGAHRCSNGCNEIDLKGFCFEFKTNAFVPHLKKRNRPFPI